MRRGWSLGRRHWAVAPALLLLAAVAVACGDEADADVPDSSRAGLRVVVSTAVIADWVGEVGGERVAVTALASRGRDAHTLQLDPSQVVAIGRADLVILNGAGLEAGFEGVIEENAAGEILVLAEGLDLVGFSGGVGEGGGAGRDPHFWLDPDLAIRAVERVREALSTADREGAVTYRARAEAYVARVRAVDAEIGAQLAALPPAGRVLVTFHDAYGYFARHYGLTVLGIVVEGPEEEPSAGELAALIERMRGAGAPAIYREPQFNARVVDQVAAETGAVVRTIYSLPVGDVVTYLDVLRANGAAIVGGGVGGGSPGRAGMLPARAQDPGAVEEAVLVVAQTDAAPASVQASQ